MEKYYTKADFEQWCKTAKEAKRILGFLPKKSKSEIYYWPQINNEKPFLAVAYK